MGTVTSSTNAAGALFGQARREILSLLFLHSDQTYYIRQVASLTKQGLGAVQRELGILVDGELVTRTQSGSQIHYQANRQSPIFAELRALLLKTVGVSELVREALGPLADKIIAACVYGSAQEGLGALVVGGVDPEDVANALAPVREQLGMEIEPMALSWHQFTRRRSKGDKALESALAGPKVFVVGDEGELGS